MASKHYFSTRNLVTIALLAGMGAALSTYVGYLGRFVGSSLGLPVGGQLLTGLHVFWPMLALVLVNKKGAGLLAAVLDNAVQFMLGGHLGILVLPVGLLEGLFAEAGYWPLRRFSRPLAMMVAGGIGSWSNLVVVQAAFHMFGTRWLFQLVSLCAFGSGVVFGGLLPYAVVKILDRAGLTVPKNALVEEGSTAPAGQI